MGFYFINVDYDTQFKENIQYKNIENYIYINFYLINNNNTKHTDKYFEILEYNWDFVFNHKKSRLFVKILGRSGARMLYLVFGVFFYYMAYRLFNQAE